MVKPNGHSPLGNILRVRYPLRIHRILCCPGACSSPIPFETEDPGSRWVLELFRGRLQLFRHLFFPYVVPGLSYMSLLVLLLGIIPPVVIHR